MTIGSGIAIASLALGIAAVAIFSPGSLDAILHALGLLAGVSAVVIAFLILMVTLS